MALEGSPGSWTLAPGEEAGSWKGQPRPWHARHAWPGSPVVTAERLHWLIPGGQLSCSGIFLIPDLSVPFFVPCVTVSGLSCLCPTRKFSRKKHPYFLHALKTLHLMLVLQGGVQVCEVNRGRCRQSTWTHGLRGLSPERFQSSDDWSVVTSPSLSCGDFNI